MTGKQADTGEDRSGDSAFDADRWVELYGDYLFRYAMLRLRNRSAAEDVVQETFLSAYAAKDKFQHRSSVKTWLVSILRNKVIDHYRRASRDDRKNVSLENEDSEALDPIERASFNRFGIWKKWYDAWEADPETLVEQQHFMRRVRDCMSGLPENLRNVFVLKAVDNLETEDICNRLEISSSNAWVILYRARMRMRECLDVNWFHLES